MLIISSCRLIDSFIGSRAMMPCSASLAWCRIFCVLLGKALASILQKIKEYLLVENEAAENCETAVQGDSFCNGKSAQAKGKGHRSKRAKRDNCYTSEERATHVQECIIPKPCSMPADEITLNDLLGRGADKRQRTNNSTCVERGTREDSRVRKE
jgi:hypothetical protein